MNTFKKKNKNPSNPKSHGGEGGGEKQAMAFAKNCENICSR